jgi:hypothetical protein
MECNAVGMVERDLMSHHDKIVEVAEVADDVVDAVHLQDDINDDVFGCKLVLHGR